MGFFRKFGEELDSIDRWRLIIAALSIVVLVVLSIVSGGNRQTKPPINGDALGRDNSETMAEYQQRAVRSLADTPNDAEVYALVTFQKPLTARQAGAVVQDLTRVNAFMVGFTPVVGIPEPIEGVNRGDSLLYQITLKSMNPNDVRSLVVHDNGAKLHAVAANPEVLTVETLPPDATWGSFAVRPVNIS